MIYTISKDTVLLGKLEPGSLFVMKGFKSIVWFKTTYDRDDLPQCYSYEDGEAMSSDAYKLHEGLQSNRQIPVHQVTLHPNSKEIPFEAEEESEVYAQLVDHLEALGHRALSSSSRVGGLDLERVSHVLQALVDAQNQIKRAIEAASLVDELERATKIGIEAREELIKISEAIEEFGKEQD